MANEVNALAQGARINHPVFQDVYNTTYEKDIITDIEASDELELSGMCETDKHGWLPVFYHCKANCYNSDIQSLNANGSLEGGIRAFEIGCEVQVQVEEGIGKYVVGHIAKYDPPRMCQDILKVVFLTSGSISCEAYFVCSKEEELVDGVDFYGDTPICNREATLLWERASTYYPFFSNESLIRIGPLCFLFRMSGQYGEHDWMSWTDLWARVDLWTQEKEDEYITLGNAMSSVWEAPYSVAPDLYWSEEFWHAMTDVQDFGGRCEGQWDEIKVYGQGEEEE